MDGAREAAMQASYEAAKKAEVAAPPEKKYPREPFMPDIPLEQIGGNEASAELNVDAFSTMKTPEDRDRAIDRYLADALPPDLANTPEAKAAMGRYVDMAVSSVRKGIEAGKDVTVLNKDAERIMKTKVLPMLRQEMGLIDAKRVQ